MSDHAADLHSDITYNHAAAHADMLKFVSPAIIPLAPPAGNPNPYPNLYPNPNPDSNPNPNPNPILIPILTRLLETVRDTLLHKKSRNVTSAKKGGKCDPFVQLVAVPGFVSTRRKSVAVVTAGDEESAIMVVISTVVKVARETAFVSMVEKSTLV
jgi:hypothetical protein